MCKHKDQLNFIKNWKTGKQSKNKMQNAIKCTKDRHILTNYGKIIPKEVSFVRMFSFDTPSSINPLNYDKVYATNPLWLFSEFELAKLY